MCYHGVEHTVVLDKEGKIPSKSSERSNSENMFNYERKRAFQREISMTRKDIVNMQDKLEGWWRSLPTYYQFILFY